MRFIYSLCIFCFFSTPFHRDFKSSSFNFKYFLTMFVFYQDFWSIYFHWEIELWRMFTSRYCWKKIFSFFLCFYCRFFHSCLHFRRDYGSLWSFNWRIYNTYLITKEFYVYWNVFNLYHGNENISFENILSQLKWKIK